MPLLTRYFPIDDLFGWLAINGRMVPNFKQLLIAWTEADWKNEGIFVHRRAFPLPWDHQNARGNPISSSFLGVWCGEGN